MVTVLLSVFNGEEWLKDCILSILNQSFKDFEFLIIDDGSNDRSLEIIKNFSNLDNRIRFLSQKNIGLTATLNKGLNIAKGDWIARIDCDDIACPDRISLQINYAIKNNLGLVGCQSNIIDSNGKLINKVSTPKKHSQICRNLKKQKKIFSHSSVMYKRQLVLGLGGYRKIMKKSQDYDLWLRISEQSKIGSINYIGVLIRDHDKRISYIDKGIEQRVFAHCANVSHNLRSKYTSNNDPLNNKNEDEILKFIKFVANNLENTKTLFFYEKLYDYKKFTHNKNLLLKFLIIPKYFWKINLFIKLIKWLVNGDFASKDIEKKWQNLHLNKNIKP